MAYPALKQVKLVLSCRSILCKNLGRNGMLLHVGEHIVLSDPNVCQVLQALSFSVCWNQDSR